MNRLILIYLCYGFALVKTYNISVPHQVSCNSHLSKYYDTSEIIVIEFEQDNYFFSCVIKENFVNHSLLSVRGLSENAFNDTNLIKIRKEFNKPNYIIMLKSLDDVFTDHPMIKTLLAKMSKIHIIITNENQYSCNNEESFRNTNIQVENFFNNLWHNLSLVNVVLSLPMTCPGTHFAFGSGKKPSGREVYNRTIQVVPENENPFKISQSIKHFTEGYPLRVNIFRRFPTSIEECADIKNFVGPNTRLSGGYCGLDGLVLSAVVEYFKFNVTLTGDDHYGYVGDDGTVSGSLGDVVSQQVDVSFASRFMVPYVDDKIVFLYYIATDCLCAAVKRPRHRPLWLYPYRAYETHVWVIMFCLTVIIGAHTSLRTIILKKYMGRRDIKIKGVLVYWVDSVTSLQFGFMTIRNSTKHTLKGIILLSSIIFSASYQGHINYVFTTVVHYPAIQTLKDIIDEGITIYISPGVKSLIDPPLNKHQEQILQKQIVIRTYEDSSGGMNEVLKQENMATIKRRSDVFVELLNFYMDEVGEPKFVVVQECFRCFFLSYISGKHFLFEEDMKLLMSRIVEAGLPEKFYMWTQNALHLNTMLHYSDNTPRPFCQVELYDLRIGFGVLLTGYALSAGVLVCELYWKRSKIADIS